LTAKEQTAANREILARAQGCLLGQFAGEMLGMPVETMSAEDIRRLYPDGLTRISDGQALLLPLGIHHPHPAIAQLTDDGEMALMLARSLVEQGKFDADAVREAYMLWWRSPAFGFGRTTQNALEHGSFDQNAQTNGALMRISPLGIFGAKYDEGQVADWAKQDSRLTHVSTVCQDSSAVFAVSISRAIRTGCDGAELHRWIIHWSEATEIDYRVIETLHRASDRKPPYPTNMGADVSNTPLRVWVLIALHNAFWQLLNADSLEAGIVDTVMLGGDTDTTAAICGALMGAVHGREAMPVQWTNAVLNCRPRAGQPDVFMPRPEIFWPIDTLELAQKLLSA
jgi:ADP-ribosylglycohydrolase